MHYFSDFLPVPHILLFTVLKGKHSHISKILISVPISSHSRYDSNNGIGQPKCTSTDLPYVNTSHFILYTSSLSINLLVSKHPAILDNLPLQSSSPLLSKSKLQSKCIILSFTIIPPAFRTGLYLE